MSAPIAVAEPPPGAADGEALPAPAPADRGHLAIADRVIEKIAATAAAEVDRATGAPRRLLGVSLGGSDDRPDVSARVDGAIATVTVVMSVAWPAPVAEVTARVRARIAARLAELAAVHTAQVDIRVTALVAEHGPERRVS